MANSCESSRKFFYNFLFFQDDVFEEAVEAFEVFKDDLADNTAVEVFKDCVIVDKDSCPVSLEKFDDLKEVRFTQFNTQFLFKKIKRNDS